MTATASTSSILVPAPVSAAATTALTSSRWWREATSGTTPPNSSWSAACEETTLESTRGPSVTAAQVSSQEVLDRQQLHRSAAPVYATPARAGDSNHMIRASSPLSW